MTLATLLITQSRMVGIGVHVVVAPFTIAWMY
jgi:hypothetical protein